MKRDDIKFISLVDDSALLKLNLKPGDLGDDELRSPANVPPMTCITLPVHKIFAQYSVNTRALFHLSMNMFPDMQVIGSGDQFSIVDGSRFCAPIVRSKNKLDMEVQLYVVPVYLEVFDVYCKKAHGLVDPFWEGYMSTDRMYNVYAKVNETFKQCNRHWFWSSGDMLGNVYFSNGSGGFSFYLSCDGIVKIHAFSDTTMYARRYFFRPQCVPYSVWSDVTLFDEVMNGNGGLYLEHRSNLFKQFKDYSKTTSIRSIPDLFINVDDGKLSTEYLNFLSYAMPVFLGFDLQDVDLFLEYALSFGSKKKPISYANFIHCFYEIFKTMNDYKRYFVLKEAESIIQNLLSVDCFNKVKINNNNNNVIENGDDEHIN